jgi:hypothetical protein
MLDIVVLLPHDISKEVKKYFELSVLKFIEQTVVYIHFWFVSEILSMYNDLQR